MPLLSVEPRRRRVAALFRERRRNPRRVQRFVLAVMGLLVVIIARVQAVAAAAWIPLPLPNDRQYQQVASPLKMIKEGGGVVASESSTAPTACPQRRDILSQCGVVVGGVMGSTILSGFKPALAGAAEEIFRRETDLFQYEFQPPAGFPGPGQKPLKTHLDEVNFSSVEMPGYQFGITVDPVRITSLTEFGTAEEVAAKVVLAEVNRDGVFSVKLMEDPVSLQDQNGSTFYQLNYLSSGKRGDKRFVAKFYVQNQKLFALTAQCKEENYASVKQGMLEAVKSFRIVQ